MNETNLNINDIIRIKAIVLDSNYPDELVNKIVDGLDDLFGKAQAFDEIRKTEKYCYYVKYDKSLDLDRECFETLNFSRNTLKTIRDWEAEHEE